jgi:archaellum component FlaG (FlaF/FlaG flagellin family)
MTTAISFMLSLLLVGGLAFTLGGDLLGAFRSISFVWTDFEDRYEDRAFTRISGPSSITTTVTSTVEITISNKGETTIGEFPDWDVIAEIQKASGLAIEYLAYSTTSPPTANKWAVRGIYRDASKLLEEVVDPGVLNPGEELILQMTPNTAVVADTYDRIVIGTPNGALAQVIFRVAPGAAWASGA